jgi:hypothetical protein
MGTPLSITPSYYGKKLRASLMPATKTWINKLWLRKSLKLNVIYLFGKQTDFSSGQKDRLGMMNFRQTV